MSHPRLSILVVNYKRYDYLRDCLESVFNSQLSEYEVIVIDHETDELLLNNIKSSFPQVQYEATEKNAGFAAGYNRAMQLARGEYFFLLNNDTVLDRAVNNQVLDVFQRNPLVAAIQPLIVFYDNQGIINNTGLEFQFLGYAWDRGFKQHLNKYRSEKRPLLFSGAAVILNKSAIEVVGSFDPDYFLYHEDVDLALRLRNAGYFIELAPSLVVYHRYAFKAEAWRYYYLERNRWFTIIKNYPLGIILAILPAAVFMEFGVLIYSIFSGWPIEKIRSWWAIAHALPGLLKKRRIIGKIRITSRQFINGLKGGVVFQELNSPLLKFIANPLLEIYWLILSWVVMFGSVLLGIQNRKGTI